MIQYAYRNIVYQTDLQEIFVKIINNLIRNLQSFCFGFKNKGRSRDCRRLQHRLIKSWKGIKYVTSKTTTKTQLPQLFKVDGKILTENKDIANTFNNFFTIIGPSVASTISATGNKTYKAFLNPPCTHNFTFSA